MLNRSHTPQRTRGSPREAMRSSARCRSSGVTRATRRLRFVVLRMAETVNDPVRALLAKERHNGR